MADEPHILLVDDERDIRDPLASYLGKNGLRVTKAADAAAAREILAAHAIDLVLLDIMMPGEDGLSLAGFIRATTSDPGHPAHRQGRGDGPHRRAGDRRRRLCHQAVQPARAARPDQGGAAADRRRRGRGPRARCRGLMPSADWVLRTGERELVDDQGVAVPLSTGEYNLLLAFVTHPRRVLTPRPAARPQPAAASWPPSSAASTIMSAGCAARSRPTRPIPS